MSDQIKHECGIVLIRLRKPLSYYQEKYGSALYGLTKLQLMMQKIRNRGQDGAGIATIKLNSVPGKRYISRKRSNSSQPLKEIFDHAFNYFNQLDSDQIRDPEWLQSNIPFTGELLLGHLRYGTHGKNSIENVHPFLRQTNWISRNLVLAGNFNLTNVDELFQELVNFGQYPKEMSDTVTVLEKIGHFLDDEVQRLHTWFKPDGYTNEEINELIFKNLDVQRLLKRASKKFDGGYAMAGLIGHGDAFVMRDPRGIRPAFYYEDEEIVVVCSERPTIQTALNVSVNDVKEVKPGHALIIKRDGSLSMKPFVDEIPEPKQCSFERIYFSRGTDRDIYLERKKLGSNLVPDILKAVDHDWDHTVFSFVPNTAEYSFYGMIKGLEDALNKEKGKHLKALGPDAKKKDIERILNQKARVEKIVVKDAKLRTFIADDNSRGDMVSHVYDVTYGIVRNNIDSLVLVDDSIVRGTTLKDSIISIVDRLKPKKIVVVSSAPQIRFPDCYGIDMSKMKEFVAFRALVELLHENNKEHLLDEVYEKCKLQDELPKEEIKNYVADLYEEFTYEEVSAKIGELLTPKHINAEVEIIFQTIENLHDACPNHTGDWYFSGNYPTPGGNRVVNKAFMLYMENKDERAY
jgi:amidophosphoribosyltransferase